MAEKMRMAGVQRPAGRVAIDDDEAPTVSSVELDVADMERSARVFLDALDRSDVVRIVPSTPIGELDQVELRSVYDRFVEAVGEPVDIAEGYDVGGAPIGERWSEIRYRDDVPDMAAFRHSKNAQPLHTDESYVSSSIGVMLFYCVRAADRGGETVFVPGRALVDHLREHERDLFERLLSVPVTYQKAGDAKTRPIIEIDDDERPTFNFNYYCVEPDQSDAAVALNSDFHAFCEQRLPAELIEPVGLGAGEGVAWKDHRVIHGRTAFDATTTGDRFIWKTGVILTGPTSDQVTTR